VSAMLLNRNAARNADDGPGVGPRVILAAQTAAEETGSRPRALRRCEGRRPWLVPIVLLAWTVSAGADQRGDAPARGGDLSPAEIQRIFDGYVMVQVQDALGLSEQQFAQAVPRLKTLQDTRRRHQQQRGRLLMELQRLTRLARGEGTDEGAIKERLTRLHEIDAQFAEDLRRAYRALDDVLDIRQQGRFRVFEEQIERKKLQLLLRARQNRPMLRRQPPLH
jgi:hypothetical protein